MGNFRDQARANAALDISISAAIARSHASRAMGQIRIARLLGDTVTESRIQTELEAHQRCLKMMVDNAPRY